MSCLNHSTTDLWPFIRMTRYSVHCYSNTVFNKFGLPVANLAKFSQLVHGQNAPWYVAVPAAINWYPSTSWLDSDWGYSLVTKWHFGHLTLGCLWNCIPVFQITGEICRQHISNREMACRHSYTHHTLVMLFDRAPLASIWCKFQHCFSESAIFSQIA